jgi:hypothetical protein
VGVTPVDRTSLFGDAATELLFTLVGLTYSRVSTTLLLVTSPDEILDFPCVDLLLKLSERLGAVELTLDPTLFIVEGYALERADEEFNELLCPL